MPGREETLDTSAYTAIIPRVQLVRLLLLAALTASPSARAASPVEVLHGVAANARFPVPTRADVGLARQRNDHATTARAVLLGRGQTLYVESDDGTRALIRPGKILVRRGGRVVRAEPGARLGDSDIRLEDLVPVTPTLLGIAQVSDDGPTGIVITGAPAGPSSRVLIVLTIDPDRPVVTRVKYYEGTISDLATFRRDDEFATVDGHLRPTHARFERPRDDASTEATLAWAAAPDTPRTRFTPAGLHAAALLAR
jgi:hypothetical protein